MPTRIIVADRIIQGVGIPIQPLRAAVVEGVGGDESGQGGVVIAGAVVHQTAAVKLFAGVGIFRFAAAADVFGFFAEGAVGQAAEFRAGGVGEDRGGVQVVAVNPAQLAVHGFGNPQAVEVVVFVMSKNKDF